MQKTDRPRSVVIGVFNFFPPQERFDHPEILSEVSNTHRLHTHDPHGVCPGTDTQKDSARCDTINGSNGVGR